MRKKPPSGLETINSGQPWSALDVADLDELVTDRGRSPIWPTFSAAALRRSRPRSPRADGINTTNVTFARRPAGRLYRTVPVHDCPQASLAATLGER